MIIIILLENNEEWMHENVNINLKYVTILIKQSYSKWNMISCECSGWNLQMNGNINVYVIILSNGFNNIY